MPRAYPVCVLTVISQLFTSLVIVAIVHMRSPFPATFEVLISGNYWATSPQRNQRFIMYSRCVVLPALAPSELTPSPVHVNIVATMINLGRYAHLHQHISHIRLHPANLHPVGYAAHAAALQVEIAVESAPESEEQMNILVTDDTGYKPPEWAVAFIQTARLVVRLAYAWLLPKFRAAHVVQSVTIFVPVSLLPSALRRAVRQHRRGRLHRRCRARDRRQVPLRAGHQPDQSAESQNGLHPRPRDRPRDREDRGVLRTRLRQDLAWYAAGSPLLVVC